MQMIWQSRKISIFELKLSQMKSKIIRGFALLVLFLPCICATTQEINFRSDIIVINKNLSVPSPDPYKRSYIYKSEPSIIRKINPVNIFFGVSLYFYQNVIDHPLFIKDWFLFCFVNLSLDWDHSIVPGVIFENIY